MGQPPPKPTASFTCADHRRWPDAERWELLDGEAYATAAPGLAHQSVVGALFRSHRSRRHRLHFERQRGLR